MKDYDRRPGLSGVESSLRVVKAHGTGNDFVIVFDPDDRLDLGEDAVRMLCDRRRGVGGDGLIRLVRTRVERGSTQPLFFMDYRNSDGSIAEMCGNGIRCVAHYLLKRGIVQGPDIPVDTRAGRKVVMVRENGSLSVDMGVPQFTTGELGVDLSSPDVEVVEAETDRRPALLRLRLPDAEGGSGGVGYVETYVVGMGNPHAVVVGGDPGLLDPAAAVVRIGPRIEKHPAFARGTNVEFVSGSDGDLEARVWERGVGETLSCGTGACAIAVAMIATGRAPREGVVIRFPGGGVSVSWSESVILEGPALEVMEAEVDLAALGAGWEGGAV